MANLHDMSLEDLHRNLVQLESMSAAMNCSGEYIEEIIAALRKEYNKRTKHPAVVNPDQCMLKVIDSNDVTKYYGPFDTYDDARSYVKDTKIKGTWSVDPLTPVQCDGEGNWL